MDSVRIEAMTAEEKMPTIKRQVLAISKLLDEARDGVSMKEQPKVWNTIDQAIATIQGLSMFLGPYSKEELASTQ